MAEETLEIRIINILSDSSVITNALADSSGRNIHMSNCDPVGGSFPQITISVDDGETQPKIPAQDRILIINVWYDTQPSPRYVDMKAMKDNILSLLDLQNTAISDIDEDEDEGLRVVQCRKLEASYSLNSIYQKHQLKIIFEIIESYGESFADGVSGNITWV